MSVLVLKFGGTSMGTLDRIEKVSEQVMKLYSKEHAIVVVVSAMSGQTDQLDALGFELIKGTKATVPDPRERDVLLSAGEQVAAALLAIALTARGCPAKSYLGWQIPIVTDTNHYQARIESLTGSKEFLSDLESKSILVVAGFQGVNIQQEITTLGRGGSDLSAVALAAALNAEECRIYTDVDGVYTADPRCVTQARRLSYTSFSEMLELSYLGSKVLQRHSVAFAQCFGVPLRILSTFIEGEGTVIGKAMGDPMSVITGLAHIEVVRLSFSRLPQASRITADLLNIFASKQIEPDCFAHALNFSGEMTCTMTVSPSEYVCIQKEIGEWAAFMKAELEVFSGISKISLVGMGLRSESSLLSKIYTLLANEGIEVQLVSTGEMRVSLVIEERSLESALRALHAAFRLDMPNRQEQGFSIGEGKEC